MTMQPTGTVTLLFSDIEGSTALLQRLGVDTYSEALDQHRRLFRGAFERYGGYEVDCEGDAFFVAFSRAEDAVGAAAEAQQALAQAEWHDECEVRVRMGIHTGEPLAVPPKYVGLDVHRAARIMAAGHGGQVLLSQVTRDLLGEVAVRDLGEHRLKDLSHLQRIYQRDRGSGSGLSPAADAREPGDQSAGAADAARGARGRAGGAGGAPAGARAAGDADGSRRHGEDKACVAGGRRGVRRVP